MAFRGRTSVPLAAFTGGVRALVIDYPLAAASWFDDVGRDTRLRDVRLDVASSGSASVAAMGEAPFMAVERPATGNLELSAASRDRQTQLR